MNIYHYSWFVEANLAIFIFLKIESRLNVAKMKNKQTNKLRGSKMFVRIYKIYENPTPPIMPSHTLDRQKLNTTNLRQLYTRHDKL